MSFNQQYHNWRRFYHEYGLAIVAGVSAVALALLFCYNFVMGTTGSYDPLSDHIWEAEPPRPPPSPRLGSPDATASKLEAETKHVLESIFQRPFTKIRPDFLHNEVTGKNLEIDLYNCDLQLAVEVQGHQHYEYTPFFQKSKEAFYNQRYRDEIKKLKLESNGITLIEVPYHIKPHRLKSFLVQELRYHGYLI